MARQSSFFSIEYETVPKQLLTETLCTSFFLAGHLFLSFAQAAAAAQAGASVVQIFVGRIRVNSSSIFVTHAKMLILC
jgi:hypothetical protein